MDKFRLKGSILESIHMRASTATKIILGGSTTQIVKLKASAVTFIASFTTRVTLLSRVSLTIKAMVRKKIKNLSLQNRVYLSVKMVIDKFSKAFLNIKVIITAKGSVDKNAKAVISTVSAFGISGILNTIKDKTLGQIKTLTLKELTFAIGVRAFVVKRSFPSVFEKVVMTVSAITVRKTKLSDIKNQTLGEIKIKTLKELTENEI